MFLFYCFIVLYLINCNYKTINSLVLCMFCYVCEKIVLFIKKIWILLIILLYKIYNIK